MDSSPKPARNPPLLVRHRNGKLQPFLRGMVTHDLVQRGVPFDDAYSIATAVRGELTLPADKDSSTADASRASETMEVETTELRDRLDKHLARLFPNQDFSRPDESLPPALTVAYGGEAQPFSRGILSRSLFAAGLDLDRSYALVLELQEQLVAEKTREIDARELALRVEELLRKKLSRKAASRYRLVRRIQRLPRPLVVYCGGASGTGKSTLALELAPLLRIQRINSSDTIRQIMRMVFSSAILPSLHRSSFEADLGDSSLQEPTDQEGLVRAFEEQSVRVCVGIRAVVERSIAENLSILVEGVHLLPGIVPFPDLEGAAHQVSFMVSTMEEEVHRSHFLARRTHSRSADRYLANFPSIRIQQNHLLQLAEDHHVPLIDSDNRDTLVPQTMRLITSALEQKLPWLARLPDEVDTPTPVILFIMDGLPDHEVRALNSRTPLEAANTPHLDRLAREGRTGLADPVAPGVVPDTASGNLAVFGQAPRTMKRGPIEAIGTGLDLAPGDIALRANFATLDEDGRLLDRRAGRIRQHAETLAEALNEIRLKGRDFSNIKIQVRAGTEHRLAIALKGEGLSSAIRGSDPGDAVTEAEPLIPQALEEQDDAAERTAHALALFEREARKVLAKHPINKQRRSDGLREANCILTRGAGRVHHLRPVEPGGYPISLACISGDRTVQGIASLLGARLISEEGMTANLDTDLALKMRRAFETSQERDLTVVHIKGADIAAHDGRPDLKVAFLERFDAELGRLLKRLEGKRIRVAITSDHTTISESGRHGADPVPILAWGEGVDPDQVEGFDERAVAAGGLGRIPLQLFLDRLFETRLFSM